MGHLYAITPFTQLDYPGELACIAWVSGCNLRCAYCHNPDIVMNKGGLDNAELLSFLEKRRGKLTAVVFSGGEATFCAQLPNLARAARNMGYKIKLDTNGTHPAMLYHLIDAGLVDTIALDYKCPPQRMIEVIGTTVYAAAFRDSLSYLIQQHNAGNIALEIRTTWPIAIMNEEDIGWMIADLDRLGYRGCYWLQNLASSGEKTLKNIAPNSRLPNCESVMAPKNFRIGFRNYSVEPVF